MKKLSVEDIKEIQLEILKKVDKYCQKNNIKYFLAYGTLLGAVRHKGYIPWDDDIDIMMLRTDYEKFIKEFNKTTDELEVLHYSIDEKFPYEFAKIHNKKTKLVENVGIKYNIGINIDLFVIDNIGNDISNAKKIIKMNNNLIKLFNIKLKKRDYHNKNLIKNIIVHIAMCFSKNINIKYITSKLDRNSQKYSIENGKYVADACQRWLKADQYMEAKCFDETIDLEFEGYKFKAPKEYDLILKKDYGDYMKLPPKDEQTTHHDYEAYKL